MVAGSAFWLSACGGGDESEQEASPDTSAITEPAEKQSRSDMEREKALAKLDAEHSASFEGSTDDTIRYAGKTQEGADFVAQMGTDVEIPEHFFDELPQYPNSVPFSVMVAGEGLQLVSVDSTDDAPVIYEFYKSKLDDEEWVIENDMTLATGRVLRAAKDGRHTVVQVQEIDGGTRIGIMYTIDD